MKPTFGQAVPSGPGPNGSQEPVTQMAARANPVAPTAASSSQRLRTGGFPQALTFRPRTLGPVGPGFHSPTVNPNGQAPAWNKPGQHGQGAQSGTPVPTAPGGTREIQRYRPPQSAVVAGHQAPASEPLRTTMNQVTRRRPSSPPLTSDDLRILQDPELAAAILSSACQARRFNPEWITNPTLGNWWSYSVKIKDHVVPSAGEFPTERKAKGETALKALTVMFDSMGASRGAVLQRFLTCSRKTTIASVFTHNFGMEPAATPVNQDVAMTGTDRTHFNRSILPVTGTSSGALSTHRSMPGRVPLLTATNPASIRRAQLPASSGLPSAGQQLRGPVMGPSAQGLFEEGQKMLESLGMVATSAWGPTQQPSNAFLQGLAAGAQLSHMLLNNAHSEGGRSSRHYRERDRQPRRDRRSRSPTTERPSAGPVRRSHDPSLPSTDRYRPTYGSIIPNVPEVEIKREASTEVGSLLGATPGVSASSSGTRSRRRSRSKPMPTNEKWDHDGFAQHYPSSPKKWDHDGFAQHYPSGPKK